MAERLRVVVAGHVNAGKTSLVRTLVRQAGFGSVAALPGTTLRNAHVGAGGGAAEGEASIDWVDTPGFEEPALLAARFAALTQPGTVERLRALLRQPEVVAEHPHEWRALSAALDADLVLLVVDSVELVLPKHRAGIELLQACGRPVLMLLNRPAHPQSQAEAWEAAAAGHGLRAVMRFDACQPEAAAWPALWRQLGAALSVPSLEPAWQAARQHRHQASLVAIADAIVSLAARRETLPAAVAGDPHGKEQATAAFREAVMAEAGAARRALITRHGFEGQDPARGGLKAVDGRWEDDLFNPEVLKDAGGKLAGGAALGAAIGLGADVALAGLSLGAGTAVGAAVGGIASQGFSAFSRKVLNRLTGQLDLSVEDGVLVVLADSLLGLLQALEARAHGAGGPWAWPMGVALVPDAQAALLEAARPARGHPEWATAAGAEMDEADEPAARRRAVEAVAAVLGALPARAWSEANATPAVAGQGAVRLVS